MRRGRPGESNGTNAYILQAKLKGPHAGLQARPLQGNFRLSRASTAAQPSLCSPTPPPLPAPSSSSACQLQLKTQLPAMLLPPSFVGRGWGGWGHSECTDVVMVMTTCCVCLLLLCSPAPYPLPAPASSSGQLQMQDQLRATEERPFMALQEQNGINPGCDHG